MNRTLNNRGEDIKVYSYEETIAGKWSVGVKMSRVCVSCNYVYSWCSIIEIITYSYVALGCDLSRKKRGDDVPRISELS